MIELTLPTMTCQHCVRTVTETVHRVDPQARVDVSLPEQRVQITSQRPAEEFRRALAVEGYEPAAA
jgi:copper chaperone